MLPPVFLSAMRFERDDQAGITIRVNTIAHAVFILVSVGLCVKVMLDTPPKFPMAAALAVCAVYLLVRMLRFIRFYGLWKNAYFEMGDDRARGFAADGKLRHGAPFDIPAGSVKRAELTTVPMTQKTPLNALKLTTADRVYIVVGLYVDEHIRRVFHLDQV